MHVYLSEINIYPVKSARRVGLDEAHVERQGLRGDRRWMLVDENGDFITQRSEPRLALVHAGLEDGALTIAARDMPSIRIPVPPLEQTTRQVRVWNDTVAAVEANGAAGSWFTRYLDRPARLVYMMEPTGRKVDAEYAVRPDDHVSFADGYPMLLASRDSLGELNRRMDAPVPMSRFRPNLVVTGSPPFIEDAWRQIRIGGMLFHVVKGCARCVVTTVDQETAHQEKEPLRTLNRFRRREGKVYFGQNLIPAEEGLISVGDSVDIVS